MPGLSLNAILLSAVALLAPSAEAVDAGRHDSELGAVEVTPVVGGLAYPWAVAFLPDNQGMLVTERPGSLRFVSPEGQLSAPLEGVPRVFASGQGPARRRLVAGVRRGPAGLPDLCRGRRGRPRRNGGGTRPVIGGQATAGGFPRDLPAVAEAFQRPSLRLAPGLRRQGPPVHRPRREQPAQHLAGPGQVAGQDRPPVSGRRRSQGQSLRRPYRRAAGALELWPPQPAGRRVESLDRPALDPRARPRGGDEINIPQAGGNYGWPLATHGINYTLLPIPEARGKAVDGTEAPHHVWEKSPAISGMAFYDAQRFPAWQHNLFIGALATQELIRLQLDGDRVVHEERLLGDLGVRIRDVRQGPDGYLYLLTDQKDGQLLRLGLAR